MEKYGLKKYRLRAIETALLNCFDEVRTDLPKVDQITFEVTRYEHDKEIRVHGYLHNGRECEIFNDVEMLRELLDKAIEVKKK